MIEDMLLYTLVAYRVDTSFSIFSSQIADQELKKDLDYCNIEIIIANFNQTFAKKPSKHK